MVRLLTDKVKDSLQQAQDGLSEPEQAALWTQLDQSRTVLNMPREGATLRELMNDVYQARNLTRLAIAGIQPDGKLLTDIAEDSLFVDTLNVDPALIKSLAKRIYDSANVQEGDTVVIAGPKSNIQILEEMAAGEGLEPPT